MEIQKNLIFLITFKFEKSHKIQRKMFLYSQSFLKKNNLAEFSK